VRWAAWLLLAPLAAGSAAAQTDPSVRWETIRTAHFYVHFSPPLEEQGRRLAVNAERAYTALARELVPPRGPIDVVLADNVDFTNGQATPFPSNRIIIYAHPPVDDQTLRYYGDWDALVIQHELTHIFHLDRTRGWWRIAQDIFGRNPLFFPNLYTPAWLKEGLAVYYESRFTGFGRIAGTAHRTIAQAAALDSDLPRLDQISLQSPVWPQGEGAYAYGSLLLEYLSETRGADKIGKFVEVSSGQVLPYSLNQSARKAFGISFEDAWRAYRDSLHREVVAEHATPPAGLAGVRSLTHTGFEAYFPRWRDSTTLIYAANTDRDVPGVYSVTTGESPRVRRLDRRNGTDPNEPIGAHTLMYDQLDYTSPYVLRNDLYRNGHRLTHGKRLSYADVRPSGDSAIVAVQDIPASTRLVRVSPDGRRIEALTRGTPDTQWAEPRWSPDGQRIVAVRWTRGGWSDIVLLDTAGTVRQLVERSQSVESSPSWTPDGRGVVFTSDRTGRTEVYLALLGDSVRVVRLGGAGAAVYYPAVSPDGSWLALSTYRGDGYHIAVVPFDTTRVLPMPPPPTDTVLVPTVAAASAAIHRYSPWRGLIPRYWTPAIGETDIGDVTIGAYTSASDVVGQHAYAADLLIDPGRIDEQQIDFAYTYSGLGLPIIGVGLSQYWTHQYLSSEAGTVVGLLVHRTLAAALTATLERIRVRSQTVWTVGTDWEARDYHTEPGVYLDELDPVYRSNPQYPSVFTTFSWSNAQYPVLAISPEDGVSLSVTGQQRWQVTSPANTSRYAYGQVSLYKSLDLPGFAHHVIALYVAGGWEDNNATSEYEVGGRNGTLLNVVPGLSVGNLTQMFFVRGFAPGTQDGTRALSGSLEYRVPLAVAARGWHLLPVFLGKTSLTMFYDAGEAWCPLDHGAVPLACSPGDVSRYLLSSVGGEFTVDAALQYDVPYRFRFGLAAPVTNRERYGASVAVPYVSFGLSF
jgi:hypothetical protein